MQNVHAGCWLAVVVVGGGDGGGGGVVHFCVTASVCPSDVVLTHDKIKLYIPITHTPSPAYVRINFQYNFTKKKLFATSLMQNSTLRKQNVPKI